MQEPSVTLSGEYSVLIGVEGRVRRGGSGAKKARTGLHSVFYYLVLGCVNIQQPDICTIKY